MKPLSRRRVIRGLAVLLFSTSMALPAAGATFNVPCPATPAMLNQAVTQANAATGTNTIVITGGPCTIVYTAIAGPGLDGSDNGLPFITRSVTINGNGSTIARSSAPGTPNFRLITSMPNVTLTLRNLIITGGSLAGANPGAAITALRSTLNLDNVTIYGNSTTGDGGGIVAQASTVTIDHSLFLANQASNAGAMYLVGSSATIRRSAFISNVAANTTGAVFVQGGTALIESVTFASNSAADGIGGVTVGNNQTSQGTATIRSVTFTDNGRAGQTAPGGAIVTCLGACGPGLPGASVPPVVHVGNSIIADTDSTAAEVFKPCSSDAGGTIVDDGGNIEYPTTACTDAAHLDPRIAAPPAGTALSAAWVYSLMPDSPAIDAGTSAGCAPTDQRGVARPDGAACDAGAYEARLPDTSAQGPSDPTEAPSISFTSPGAPGATFECAIDQTPFAACASPYAPRGLAAGSHTIAVRARVDGFTDSSPALVSFIVADTTAPVVECTAPAAGGWKTGDVVVACAASDGAGSGLANPADSTFTLSTSGDGRGLSTASRTVTDAAGNATTVGPFGPYDVDKTVPVVVCTAPPSGPWTNADVTVTCTASDAVSGLAVPANAAFSLSTSGEGSALSTTSLTISDAAGNSATAGPFGPFKVDKTAPAFTCAPPVAGAWSKGQVSVSCTATDGGSGIADADASFTLTTSGEGSALETSSRTITDAAGNSTTVGPFGPFKVDMTAPSVTCSPAPAGWSRTAVSLTCTGTDIGSGLGAADQSFTLSTSGEGSALTIAARTVTDAAGNSTTVGPFGPFKVDSTAPVVQCIAPSTAPWSRADVLVSCTASDTGSGIAAADQSFALSTSGEGSALTIAARTVTDAAGNATTVGPFGPYKVDKTAPSITAPGAVNATATGSSGAVIGDATLGSASASDASGAPSVTRSGVPAGNQFPVGTTTVTYTATDAAGNTASATQVVTVTASSSNLQPFIEAITRAISTSRLDAQTKALLIGHVRQLPTTIQGLTPAQRTAAVARINVIVLLLRLAPQHFLPPDQARALVDALNGLAAAIRAGSGGGSD